jgi:hypothetical protein
MGNYFTSLYEINVNAKVEKKNGLSYLSWAWAWAEVKKLYPTAIYTIYENKDGWFYHTDGKSGWVKTGVTIEGVEHIEYLPIMDFKNKSIIADNITSFDVNKAIQRSLTKAVARHGLGLYVYAGEDLPEADNGEVRVSDVQVANENEPIRKNTVELINVKLGELNAERLARFNTFYQSKFSFKKYEQLTEKEGRYLIALLSKEVQ